jgi:hypothetical protein
MGHKNQGIAERRVGEVGLEKSEDFSKETPILSFGGIDV